MSREISDSQNFIHSEQLVKDLLDLPEVVIDKDDSVIEIGPGKGIISDELTKRVGDSGELILVELDKEYFSFLKSRYAHLDHVKVLNMDITKYDFPRDRFKVFSNIPFNYTSDILSKLLNPSNGLDAAYVIMQIEALERWAGGQIFEDTGESLKSLLLYPFYNLAVVYDFARNDFKPRPSVDIVLVKIERRGDDLIENRYAQVYKDFIAAISNVRVGEGVWTQLFSRKQLYVLYKKHGLVKGKGVKYQSAKALLNVFNSLVIHVDKYNWRIINGAMSRLDKTNSMLEKEHRTR